MSIVTILVACDEMRDSKMELMGWALKIHNLIITTVE